LALAPLLGGCVTDGTGSVAGGECKVFEAPQFAVRGATQHDQDWIDPTIESGIGGCKWKRPAPRPAEWDAPKVRNVRKVAPDAKPAKKPPLWLKMLRSPLVKSPLVVSVPEAPPAIVPEPAPAIAAPPLAPPPCRPIDELLRKCGQ
jgi:hypothetical protein